MDETTIKELQKAADMAGLEMEFLELRMNSDRYIWMRDNFWPTIFTNDITFHRNDLWDSAIDAAMLRDKKP